VKDSETTPHDPLDAEIYEMLDFYWQTARRREKGEGAQDSALAAKPRRRKAVMSRKLSTLRAIRQGARAVSRHRGA
jgi:hypothetical protein